MEGVLLERLCRDVKVRNVGNGYDVSMGISLLLAIGTAAEVDTLAAMMWSRLIRAEVPIKTVPRASAFCQQSEAADNF